MPKSVHNSKKFIATFRITIEYDKDSKILYSAYINNHSKMVYKSNSIEEMMSYIKNFTDIQIKADQSIESAINFQP